MKLKALIVESTRHYRGVLEKHLSNIGVECDIYATAEEALTSPSKPEYAFMLVSRYLDDTTGELFLHRYREKYLLGDALTIMLTSDDVPELMLEANEVGFKLVFNKKNLGSIQTFLTSVLNNRTLNLKGKILFIEDQQSVANAIVAIFESYHADIDHVLNLEQARRLFSENYYDLVITDYHLNKDETGDDIIEMVRNYDDASKTRIPVLVVSAEADQKKRTSFLRNGANDFIIKPFDEDELVVRSSNLIKNNQIFEQVKKQEKELTRLAMTDQLTGLYNRHSLFDIGPKYLSDAIRHTFSVSLLVIDLDHFKNINDRHGHSVGDSVLKSVGEVLNNNCRPEDFVARFGGEEFVMILTHCDIDFAETKAENIRLGIEKNRPVGLTVTASIGAAAFSKNDNFQSLFEKADRAVYEAKESGRNRVVVHSDKFDNVV